MITDTATYFADGCGRCPRFASDDCSARRWSEGLARLRAICLEVGLAEEVKWGHPCYTHAGRNIAIIGAHRADFRISFFEAALMTDPDGVLERQGAQTQHADMIRFSDVAAVEAHRARLGAYLREAMG
ncbi:MAG: DUF1801 domain-containing protein, partial [Pseudomonadota bacterium]